jgi:hypothetical protein
MLPITSGQSSSLGHAVFHHFVIAGILHHTPRWSALTMLACMRARLADCLQWRLKHIFQCCPEAQWLACHTPNWLCISVAIHTVCTSDSCHKTPHTTVQELKQPWPSTQHHIPHV